MLQHATALCGSGDLPLTFATQGFLNSGLKPSCVEIAWWVQTLRLGCAVGTQ